MQAIFETGLGALSVQQVGDLLSHLKLDRFVADLKERNVRALFCIRVQFCVILIQPKLFTSCIFVGQRR